MILSKQFLNELVDKKIIKESVSIKDTKRYNAKSYDIFLSHSSGDKEYAIKIMQLLELCGYTVYIDVADNSLDEINVTAKTARILAKNMNKCKGLLYLHSSRASVSKWCPWELGYFSGFKNFRCANIPLLQFNYNQYEGQEYLDIYCIVQYAKTTKGTDQFWIYDKNGSYTTLNEWLNGKNPTPNNE